MASLNSHPLKKYIDNLRQENLEQSEQIKRLKAEIGNPDLIIQDFIEMIVPVFAQMIDMRLGISTGTSESISHLARKIDQYLKLDEAAIRDIYHAGWLHNIGLMGLKDELLTTPYNQLTKDQKKALNSAPLKGEAVLISIPQFQNTARIIRHLYERYDGKGYPDELFGDRIPIGSRILSVAVDFNELQNGIFFGEVVNSSVAFDYIVNAAGKKYDPVVVEAFKAQFESTTHQALNVSRELSLRSADVEAGMRLTQNLIMDDGMLLLGSGQVLTNTLIDRIQHLEKRSKKPFIFHVKIDHANTATHY